MGVEDDEIAALQAARKGTALGAKAGGEFDRDLYGGGSAKGYAKEIVDDAPDDDEAMADVGASHPATKANAPVDEEAADFDPFAEHRAASGRQAIAERESEYQKRGRALQRLSPERGDVFADKTPARSYKDVMASQNMDHERDALLKKIADGESLQQEPEKKKRRWDDSGAAAATAAPEAVSRFQDTPGRFDQSPARGFGGETPSRFDATPGRFDATPGRFDATPGRFDGTPSRFAETPGRFGNTPSGGRFDATFLPASEPHPPPMATTAAHGDRWRVARRRATAHGRRREAVAAAARAAAAAMRLSPRPPPLHLRWSQHKAADAPLPQAGPLFRDAECRRRRQPLRRLHPRLQ